MSLIFDCFPSRAAAERFAGAVLLATGRADTRIFDTVAESDAADPFPFELAPPIVHVSRESDDFELELALLATASGGRFAGT